MRRKIRYIGIALLTIIAAVVSIAWHPQPDSFEYYQTATITSDQIVQNPMQHYASIGDQTVRYQLNSVYESEKISTDNAFNALIMRWHEEKPFGTNIAIEMRFNETDGWTEWEPVTENIDHQDEITDDGNEDQLLFTDNATGFQYRITAQSISDQVTPVVSGMSFEYIKNNEQLLKNTRLLASTITPHEAPLILSRSDWGADEKFTYTSFVEEEKPYGENNDVFIRDRNAELKDDKVPVVRTVTNDPETGEDLRWNLQYPDKISKIIIHHTASNKDVKRPLVALRNIYYYHAVSKKWGDIGYNYIIDQYGNIYEGRKGGDSVVGGHAHPFNRGTIGIALLGNFEDEQPSFEMTASLIKILKVLTERHGIDPLGSDKFDDVILPNIMGHRDVNSTSCPGDSVYANLPAIRSVVAELKGNSSLISNETAHDYNFDVITEIDPLLMQANSETVLTLKLQNTGTQSWGSGTFLIANDSPENQGRIEFISQNEGAKQQESTVKPGEIGTYAVHMKSGVKSGFLNFDFTLIYNGSTKTSKYFSVPVYIQGANSRYTIESHDQSSDQVEYGETVSGSFVIRNDGSIPWEQSGPYAVKMIFDDPLWKQSELLPQGELVLATMQENHVNPGEIAHFNYKLTAPYSSKQYHEPLALHHESIGKLSGTAPNLALTVGSPVPSADVITASTNEQLQPGDKKTVTVTVKNSGQNTWYKSGDAAVTMVTIAHPAVGIPKELTFNEASVGPGQQAHFSLPLTAPNEKGSYTIRAVLWQYSKRITPEPIEFTLNVGQNEQLAAVETISEKPMRVKMTFDQETVQITSTRTFTVSANGDLLMTLAAGKQAKAGYTNNKYVLTAEGKTILSDSPLRFTAQDGVIEVLNMNKRPSWNPSINDTKFRGTIETRWYNNQLVVINELPLEDYVKGIGEVPNSEPYEKIKTMMVLARTYAKYYRDLDTKFPGAPYDLSDDPNESQKYLGYNFELRAPRIAQAVQETRGEVVTYDGQLIKTPYFNSSAGKTLSAQQVWGWTNTPYLQSVDDPLCTEGVQRGHGVGLSGCGATAAANLGKNYKEIIKYYYQGVEINR